MERHWLITWTCYGNWLPGDRRGFMGWIEDDDGRSVIHNEPGTPFDADMPNLESYARSQMKAPPVSLDQRDANTLIVQFQETARVRRWLLQAASVMFNHLHVLVSVPADPDPEQILETLKSWGTRSLKKVRPLPDNGTYWTAKGSTRKLPGEAALRNGVIYVVRKQPNPLAVYYDLSWQENLDVYDARER